MKVTVYGDSILKGVRLEEGQYRMDRSWEERLAASFGLTLQNRSRFGCTIQKALPVIRRDCALPAEGEEHALLELGGNDCDYDWAEISADPERDYDCKTPPRQFVARYREAFALLRESGRVPVILTLPPIHSERYLRFICRGGLSRANILRWLGEVEAISRWQEKYSNLVRAIAAEEGARLIDLRAAFPREPGALEKLLCSDGIHPSRAGQELIYDTLCQSLMA